MRKGTIFLYLFGKQWGRGCGPTGKKQENGFGSGAGKKAKKAIKAAARDGWPAILFQKNAWKEED